MTLHLQIGGSNIGRILVCRASALASRETPVMPENPYAKEGTIAHKLLERALNERLKDVDFLVDVDPDVTQDMAFGVKVALEYVRERQQEGALLVTESFVELPGYSGIAGGTSDIRLYYPSGLLEIVDFKYGFDPVEADCAQNKFYAICAMGDYITHARLSIIQPRAFHADGPVRSVEVSDISLAGFRDEVVDAIEEARAEFAPFSPKPGACHNCPRAAACPALENAALAVPSLRNVREIARGQVVLPSPSGLGADRLAYIMQMAPLLRDWLKDVEEHAYARAMSGDEVPGYKLVKANNRREYPSDKTDTEIAEKLSEISNKPPSEFFRKGLIPITQAQALIAQSLEELGAPAKGRNKQAMEMMAFIVDRNRGDKITLVPNSDNRAAVTRQVMSGFTFKG